MRRWPATTRWPWWGTRCSDVALEDRGLGLLHLEDERVGFVAPDEQEDVAAGPDAPDADDLAGRVDVAELLEWVVLDAEGLR